MNTEAPVQDATPGPDEAVALVKSFLEDLLHRIEPNLFVEIERDGPKILVNLTPSSIFAEREGASIQSLEHLADLYLRRNLREEIRVHVDMDNFRAQRTDGLRQLAQELAEQVMESKEIARMEHMTSWERKIVHEALESVTEVRTYSEGNIERHVVIAPQRESKKPGKKPEQRKPVQRKPEQRSEQKPDTSETPEAPEKSDQ